MSDDREGHARRYRSALGAFATGVTIVTTRDGEGRDVGLTANSFNSVSLDPPMVLWSLAKNARSLPAFLAASHFAVHVLAADQEELSLRFATRGSEKFSGLDIERGATQVPLLRGCPTTTDRTTAFMGTRRKSRELALQMLFQADLGQQLGDDVRKTFWKGRGDVEREVQGFAEDIFRVAQDRSEDIDKLIKAHADNWRIDRMAAVDRNVLRAAVAEMVGFPGTPRAVIINEAIEIARKFSAPESAQFINGVLDSIGKELEAGRAVER